MSVTLNMVPEDVLAYASAHVHVMARVLADSTADTSTVASVGAAVGPVGAEFTTALTELVAQVRNAGAELAHDYQQIANGLCSGTQLIVSTDETAADQFTPTTTGI
ncbi:hypothetical protein DE4576_04879 [Mycobacterium marinum]|uniref:type VII secretion target n=1 Tax=Mycobacterium marinum TaxID=1781 RepID=UPI000EF12AEB|nr:type VII secretion target [Mycobacterium marinum]RFZ63238.1 hypothetical protein DE4576_04879 [Mycobacterium marinum]